MVSDQVEQYLNQTWRPTVAYVGAGGLPKIRQAGNVLRKETSVKIALRLPPTVDSAGALATFTEILTKDPPYGCEVTLSDLCHGNGWAAPPLDLQLEASFTAACQAFFGSENKCRSFGQGGSIPFVNELKGLYPDTAIIVTGVGGFDSNPHNPNESIELEYAKKMMKCISYVLGSVA